MIVRNERPDAIILDINLPDSSGTAGFDHLREVLPDVPIIMVTGNDGELAGAINISEIVRGNLCSGYLGYYAFAPHNGRGYMKKGISAVLAEAFSRHKLHRLEANIQPENIASRELVRRLGFRQEGFSPRYLKIGGRWRDHERWAITAEEWKTMRIAG